jgi:hypothetical protein
MQTVKPSEGANENYSSFGCNPLVPLRELPIDTTFGRHGIETAN